MKYFKCFNHVFILLLCCLLSSCAILPINKSSRILPENEYNVLWLSAESLQADHLGCYGYHRDTTPILDAFAKTGVLFERAVNGSCWTSESMVTDFLGMYSPVHGVNTRNKQTPASWLTPIEILRDAGYTVPKLQGYHADVNYNNLGFNPDPTPTDPHTYLKSVADKKFFVWYHLLDPHLPYKLKWEADRLYWDDSKVPNQASRERIRIPEENSVVVTGTVEFLKSEDTYGITALYDGCLRVMDRKFGRIIKTLEELGLRDKTIIVFAADHGEELLEHGFVGHASTAKKANIHQEVTWVPIIISFPPGLKQGARISTQVRKVDIMPTIFELLGLPQQPYFQGESLVALANGEVENPAHRPAYTVTSMQGYKADDPEAKQGTLSALSAPPWKLIKQYEPGQPLSYQLYNTDDDPGEFQDVISMHPETASSMKAQLNAFHANADDWADKWFSKKKYVEKGYYVSAWAKFLKRIGLGPKPVDLTGVTSPPVFISPEENFTFTSTNTRGVIKVEWEGREDVPYLFELHLGEGDYLFDTVVRNKGNTLVRRFKESYWDEFIAAYDPAKFRVKIDHPDHDWSEWRTVHLK